MIEYIPHSAINKSKWDNCIGNSAFPLVYGRSWFLDIVCPGWDALVEGDYKAVMPVTKAKKYGINYVFQPAFTQQLGVFSASAQNNTDANQFIRKIPKKYKLVDIGLNAENIIKPERSIKIFTRVNYELNLARPYQNLTESFSVNNRRNIRKAVKKQIQITNEHGIEEIIRLGRENLSTILKQKHFDVLHKLIVHSIEHGHGFIKAARNIEGKMVSASFFLVSDKRIINIFPVSNDEGKQLHSMFAIINEVIKENANSDRILDFEGSDNTGIARFFAGFGSRRQEYKRVRINRLPLLIRWLV